MRYLLLLAAAVVVLSGCVSGGGLIPSTPLTSIQQKIEACSAGFGSDIQAGIVANYKINEDKLSGETNAGFKASASTAAFVFSVLPDDEKLKGYELYVSCLKEEIKYPKGTAPLFLEKALQLVVNACIGNYVANIENKKPEVQLFSLDDLNDKIVKGDGNDLIRLQLLESYHRCLEKLAAAAL